MAESCLIIKDSLNPYTNATGIGVKSRSDLFSVIAGRLLRRTAVGFRRKILIDVANVGPLTSSLHPESSAYISSFPVFFLDADHPLCPLHPGEGGRVSLTS